MQAFRPSIRFQNTFRLESRNPFNKDEVYQIMKEIMDCHFNMFDRFDSKLSVGLCRTVTDEILQKVKEKRFDRYWKLLYFIEIEMESRELIHSDLFFRYKIIVIVSVCEKLLQSMKYVNKNLWDASKDSNVTYIFNHPNFTAIGTCYGIYFD